MGNPVAPQCVSVVDPRRRSEVHHENACGAGLASPLAWRAPAPHATPKRRSPTRKEVGTKESASRTSTAALSQIFGAWSPGKRTFTAFSQRGARCVAEEARSGFFRVGRFRVARGAFVSGTSGESTCGRLPGSTRFVVTPRSGGGDPRHSRSGGARVFEEGAGRQSVSCLKPQPALCKRCTDNPKNGVHPSPPKPSTVRSRHRVRQHAQNP